MTSSPEEARIRALIDEWTDAIRNDRQADILSHHMPGALIFDVLKPLQYKGCEAYRKSWANWQPSFAIPSLFEMNELQVTVGGDVAFCHGLIRCGGTLPSGEQVEDWVRATLCLRKIRKRWRIAHQHISMPVSKT